MKRALIKCTSQGDWFDEDFAKRFGCTIAKRTSYVVDADAQARWSAYFQKLIEKNDLYAKRLIFSLVLNHNRQFLQNDILAVRWISQKFYLKFFNESSFIYGVLGSLGV